MRLSNFWLYCRLAATCLTVAALSASEHHGIVKSGGLAVPGATVSAIQGDKKLTTTTDDQGAYAFAELADGTWTIQVDMFGFSRLSREVGIAPGAASPEWDLRVLSLGAMKQELASAAAPKPAAATAASTPAAASTPVNPAPAATADNSQRPNRPNFPGGGRGNGGNGANGGNGGPGGRPSIRQAVAQNGFQRADVNASADAATLEAQNGAAGSGDFGGADLNQSASDSLIVNGSVSGGLNIPQQNDWFGFGRGFDGGFGPGGGPGGPGGPGGFGTPDSTLTAGGGPGGPGGPGAGGPGGGGGGRGGRGGGGGFGGFGGGRGFGGRGGRGGRGPGNLNAFGNGRRNRRQQYNGNIALILDNSALDARPYSLTGQDTPKAAYAKFRSTGMFGGPLKIPHLISGQNTTFTINYQLTRSRNANTSTALMPDAAERVGDFSQALNPLNGLPITINDPLNGGAPFTNNVIPTNRLSPQALALLSYYPSPNFSGQSRYNYQIPIVGIGNQSNINTRLSHTINAKNQVNGNFAWQGSDTQTPNVFGFTDTTHMTGINSAATYTYHFTTRLISNLRYNFSRQATQLTPYFANLQNVSGAAGIQGNDQSAQFYGPPSLIFSSGFAGLSDGNPALNHNTTQQVGENLIWVRAQHNITFGADYRRLDFNQFSQQNPRGTLNFNSSYTGLDFADFLLGYPGSSSIAFGNADKYFRASWLDAFVNDDWRISSRLSVNIGIRWDYQAPVTELYNRLVNLGVGTNFTSDTPICGVAKDGCTTASSAGYPNSLTRPNYREFQPRVGLAWRPFAKASTVVRAGYGLYYNTSVYQQLASQMAQQAPLSFSVTQPNSLDASGQPLFNLGDAFATKAINSTSQTFALDPNFQIGYLHYWQLSVQQNLKANFVATLSYNGNKGTHQVQEFLPNTYPAGTFPAGTASPFPAGYVYETSGGNSNYNAVSGQLQRRFRSGLSGNILYTFSKAIDDSQGIGGRGGAGSAYAQNWLDAAAERSISSFNRTHVLNLQMQWSTGQGTRGGGLLTGWKGALVKDWTFTSTVTLGSGLPLTPIVLSQLADGTGINGTVRAEYLGGSLAPTAAGYGFNPHAFGAPLPGQWGDAGRNIITGPGQFSVNASAGRVFRVSDRRSFDLRFDSTNALNHVTFTSWNVNYSPTNALFGLPANANGMRTIQATLRFRF